MSKKLLDKNKDDMQLENRVEVSLKLNKEMVTIQTLFCVKTFELNDLGLQLQSEVSSQQFLKLLTNNLFSLVKETV